MTKSNYGYNGIFPSEYCAGQINLTQSFFFSYDLIPQLPFLFIVIGGGVIERGLKKKSEQEHFQSRKVESLRRTVKLGFNPRATFDVTTSYDIFLTD